MKFWTVQPRTVVEQVISQGYYYADFSQSKYKKALSAGNEGIDDLYSMILQAFNIINTSRVEGLIFCFGKDSTGSKYEEFSSIEDFVSGIIKHQDAVKSLWNYLASIPENVILELDTDDTGISRFLNPLAIDINDFQAIMPPIMELPGYPSEVLIEIFTFINQGRYHISTMPSGLVQLHLPYISKSWLSNVYSMFPID